MNTQEKEIIAKIVQIRLDRGLKQTNVAQGLGLEDSTYSKIENNQVKLTVKRLSEIATFFQMDLLELLTYPKKYVCIDDIKSDVFISKTPKVILQIEVEESKRDLLLKSILGKDGYKNLFN